MPYDVDETAETCTDESYPVGVIDSDSGSTLACCVDAPTARALADALAATEDEQPPPPADEGDQTASSDGVAAAGSGGITVRLPNGATLMATNMAIMAEVLPQFYATGLISLSKPASVKLTNLQWAELSALAADARGADVHLQTEPPDERTAGVQVHGDGEFEADLIVEGVWTDDGRFVEKGALTWREPPLPMMYTTETSMFHEGAKLGGAITALTRVGDVIHGIGVFADTENGQEFRDLVRDGMLTGVSADISASVVEIEEDTNAGTFRLKVMEGKVLGATGVPFPAFDTTKITTPEPAGADGPDVGAPAEDAVAASAAGVRPPDSWLGDPGFDTLTPLTVDEPDDLGRRRVYGHIAGWETCHIGHEGVCLTPPRSTTDYAHFLRGVTVVESGAQIATGPLTLGTGHADLRYGPQATVEHYDNTGTQAAYVNLGEDEHGIWAAGWIKPGVPDHRVVELQASPPSGDWRRMGRSLELVAILCVNTPGFPIARSRVASGEQFALVAAGAKRHPERIDIVEDLARRNARTLSVLVDVLGEDIAERIAASLV